MKIPNKTMLILLLISFVALPAKAQNKVTLDDAIKTALENNQAVKIERLKSDYQQKLIRSAANLPVTNVNSEFGQINSNYNDTRFGISQSFDFPTVYSRQKEVLTSEWKTASALVLLKEAALKKEVTQNFHVILLLTEKEKLLHKSDSLLTEFLRKSSLRLEKGESNILEKTTAEIQLGQLKMQLLQLQQDKELLSSKFQFLLNSENAVVPTAKSFKIENQNSLSENTVEQHPILKTLEQQKETAVAQTKLEKARKLPVLTFGYNNMSITGNGADNVLYDKSTRFHSAQVGLGIPLLGGSQKAKVKASKIQEQIAEEEYQREKNTLEQQLNIIKLWIKKNQEKLDYFEKTALPNAMLITETANRQFLGGDINYLDWVLLVNQSIMVNNSYIDTVNLYNENIIELNYLTSKN